MDVITDGEFYADEGAQRVFHDAYHPNADKWTTARTLSLTGDVTGSVSWDGSANASITATVANDSHTHDTRYVQQGGTSFSGEYPMVVRVSDRNFYSDNNIRFRGSDSTLIIDGAGNTAGGNIKLGESGEGSNKWSYITSSHYNDTSQSKGFTLIGGLSLASENKVIIGGSIYESNPSTSIEFWGHTATTHSTGGTLRAVLDSGGFNLKVGGYKVNGTTVIDDSRNAYFATGDFSGVVKLDDELQFTRGSSDYSNYIRSSGYPSQGYTSSTSKYWLEYSTKGGHHFVVNSDGGAGAPENNADDFTIWQGAVDGDRLLSVSNVGNVDIAGALTSSGASFTGTVTVSQSGDTFTINPHSAGIDLHSTGNIAPHYQTDFTLYTGNIGTGTETLSVDSSGNLSVTGTISGSDYKIGTTTVIDSSRNFDGATMRLSSSNDLSLSSTSHAFQVGSSAGVNLAIDNNEIMARNNGAVNTLALNADGGEVSVGNNNVADADFKIRRGVLKIGDTTVIDKSRNLTNIGTIQNGSVWINNSDSNAYNENIRLFDASNGVSVIAFGATGVSGTPRHSILSYASDTYGFDFRDGTTSVMRLRDAGVDVRRGGFLVGGTTAIDSARNATFATGSFSGNASFSGAYAHVTNDLRIGTSSGATNQTGIIKEGGSTFGLGLFTWGDSAPIQIGGGSVDFKKRKWH